VEFYALLRPMQWYQWEQHYHALIPKQVAALVRWSSGSVADSVGVKIHI